MTVPQLFCTLLSVLPKCPLQNSLGSAGVTQWLLLSNLQHKQQVSSWNSLVEWPQLSHELCNGNCEWSQVLLLSFTFTAPSFLI